MWLEANTRLEPALQQLAGVVRENVGIAAHFVDRPAAAAFADVFAQRGLPAGNGGGPDHVVKHVARADRRSAAAGVRRNVVHFSHFDRFHPAIFGEPGRRRMRVRPTNPGLPALTVTSGVETTRSGSPKCPFGAVDQRNRRRQVGRIAFRSRRYRPTSRSWRVPDRSAKDRSCNAGFRCSSRCTREASRRACRAAAVRSLIDFRPRARLLVSDQRHGRDRVRLVAVLAASLQNRSDVFGESHNARHRRKIACDYGETYEETGNSKSRRASDGMYVHGTPSIGS